MFILVVDHFCHLAENFLISDLAVGDEGSQSLSEVCMFCPQTLVDCVEKDLLDGLRVIRDVCVGLF